MAFGPEQQGIIDAVRDFQSELRPLKPNATNPFFNNHPYATIDHVISEIQPLLTKNALCLVQEVGYSTDSAGGWLGNSFVLKTRLIHASGGELTSILPVGGAERKGSTPLQVMGGDITVARRYAICALLGVTITGEDVDGNVKATRQSSVRTRRQAPKEAPVTWETKRARIEQAFQKFGITDVPGLVDKTVMEDLTEDDVQTLRGKLVELRS